MFPPRKHRFALISFITISIACMLNLNVQSAITLSQVSDDIGGTYTGVAGGSIRCPDPDDDGSESNLPATVVINTPSGLNISGVISSRVDSDIGLINVVLDFAGTVTEPGAFRTLEGTFTARPPLVGQGTFTGTWDRNRATNRDELTINITGSGTILGGDGSCTASATIIVSRPTPSSCTVQVTTVSGKAHISPIGSPDGLELKVKVIDQTNQLVPQSTLQFEHKILDNAANDGHNHTNAGRPKGIFTIGGSNSDNSIKAVYLQPKVAGTVDFKVKATTPQGATCTSESLKIDVKVDNLQELIEPFGPAFGNYQLIGSKEPHMRSHYGTAGMVSALIKLADNYNQEFHGQPNAFLAYNDMSLPWGGYFDLNNNWTVSKNESPIGTGHKEHSEGTATDLRSITIPDARWSRLLQLANGLGLHVLIHNGSVLNDPPHWHLRYGYGPECEIFRGPLCKASDFARQDAAFGASNTVLASSTVTVHPSVQVSFDPVTGLHTYRYTFRNDSSSLAEVSGINLSLKSAAIFNITAPQGWTSVVRVDGSGVSFRATDPGPISPNHVDTGNILPSPFQIRPGQTSAEFSFQSPDPPAVVDFYAEPFKQIPVFDESDPQEPPSMVDGSFKGPTEGPVSTLGGNRIDDPWYFVRQHYQDFLNREPDDAGFRFWANEITGCGLAADCREIKRINVSAAYFLSIEFQGTGYLVYRINQASFGQMSKFSRFLHDTQMIGRGVVVGQQGWEQLLEGNKRNFIDTWVNQESFRALYDNKTPTQYVDALIANTGVAFSQTDRALLINGLTNGTETRATVLRKVAENEAFTRKEFNRAFVLMQYFGYLQRNPDDAPDNNLDGFNFWLTKLNQFNGNFIQAEMVKAFITSIEYRRRFGEP